MGWMNKVGKLYRTTGLSPRFLIELWRGLGRICARKREQPRVYRRHGVIWSGREDGEPVLYLTIDVEQDCAAELEGILDALEQRGVPAAFFLIGADIERNLPQIKRAIAQGHLIANHTMNHPRLTGCSKREIRRELKQCRQICRDLTGRDLPKIMRPPYGEIDPKTAAALHRMGYKTILWNLHVRDYMPQAQPTWEMFRDYLDTALKPGGVILQHSYSKATARYLGDCIDDCHAKGYRFAPLEELIRS